MKKPSFEDGKTATPEDELDKVTSEFYDTIRFDKESTPEEYFANTSDANDDEDDVEGDDEAGEPEKPGVTQYRGTGTVKERNMLRRFSENPTVPSRALQIWQILVGKAHNRQTITYGILAGMMGYAGAGILGQFLDPVMHFCNLNGLPQLTVLVVNQDSGLPGPGLPGTDVDTVRERVFGYDWYAVMPPTPAELHAAWVEGNQARTSGKSNPA